MKKNVLSIIYFFPPIAGSGVQRPLKFVKYMPQFGYEAVVETVKNGYCFAYDYNMLDEIPKSTKIYRSNSGETLWLRKVIEKVSSFKKNKKGSQDKEDTVKSQQSAPGLKARLFDFIDLHFFIPDSKIRWYSHAVKDVDRVLKNEKIDCIYSTSAPFTVHLIALHAKKKTNLPWIADFRDPWVGNAIMTKNHSERRKRKEAKLEREVITHADKVLMVTEPICERYRKRYPEFKDKFITITNGFDGADFKSIEPIKEDKFTICYTGLLSNGRTPETLFKAIDIMIDKNSKLKGKIKIKFIGYAAPEYIGLLSKYNCGECVENLTYMPHDECVKHLKGADVNLIILPDMESAKGDFTGKIFDYIGAERPVLGIMPSGGVASNLIIDKGMGYTYNHSEVDGVCEFLTYNYEKWEKGENVNTDAIRRCSEYDRINLTKSLTEAFDEITK